MLVVRTVVVDIVTNLQLIPVIVACLISSLTRSLSVHSAYNTRNGCSVIFGVYNHLMSDASDGAA